MNPCDDVEAFFHQKFPWMIATFDHTFWNIFDSGAIHMVHEVINSMGSYVDASAKIVNLVS